MVVSPNPAVIRELCEPLPDFMTNARRLLMLSAVFFAFFVVGAIFANAPAEEEVVDVGV